LLSLIRSTTKKKKKRGGGKLITLTYLEIGQFIAQRKEETAIADPVIFMFITS